jgi:hypothetical protein
MTLMRKKKQKITKRTRKVIKILAKLRKAGLVQSGYSLELPFSKRLSSSGTIDYGRTINIA